MSKEFNIRGQRGTNDAPIWAAFDVNTKQMYIIDSKVLISVVNIGATLAPLENQDKEEYVFRHYHTFWGSVKDLTG